MRKSLVIPFHDGEKYLKYSLPSLSKLDVDEFVIIFDRVSDNLMKLFEFYFPKIIRHKCKFVIKREPSEVNHKQMNLSENEIKDWVNVRAKIFSMGLSLCEGDLLFVSAEDIILDPKNFDEKFWFDESVGFVDFRYNNFDPYKINFRNAFGWALIQVMDRFRKQKATQRSGIFGIRKSVYDLTGIEDVPTEEDWLRRRVVEKGFKHIHVIDNLGNVHLRTVMDRGRQILQGRSRFRQGYGLLKVVGHAVLWFKPYVIEGWIKEYVGAR